MTASENNPIAVANVMLDPMFRDLRARAAAAAEQTPPRR